MKYPIIGENDLVYSYKEQWFTGFAPCFKDGLYSLACCKGGKKTGGMRVSLCNHFNEIKEEIQQGKRSIWVISIAGNDISKTEDSTHHCCEKGYMPGDALCLAKITSVCSLAQYWKDHNKERIDAIYNLINGKIEWQCNKAIGGHGEHKSDEQHNFKSTDCAIGYKGLSEEHIFQSLHQILISDEYYVFKPEKKICDTLNIGRGWAYKGEGRAKALKEFVEKNCDFAYTSGENPFINTSNNNTRGCK